MRSLTGVNKITQKVVLKRFMSIDKLVSSFQKTLLIKEEIISTKRYLAGIINQFAYPKKKLHQPQGYFCMCPCTSAAVFSKVSILT